MKRTIVLWLFSLGTGLSPASRPLLAANIQVRNERLKVVSRDIFVYFCPKTPGTHWSVCVCVCRLAFFQLPSVLSISRLSSTTTTFTVHRRSRFQSKEENKLFPTSEESINFLISALKTIITTPSTIVKNHKFYFMK